ncbi:MAG TPA: DEAD/DEAH box helicase family protein [Polyangiaceae bacterium]
MNLPDNADPQLPVQPLPTTGEQLAAVQSALGLNKSQLAEVCAVKRPAIYDWYAGNCAADGANAARLAQLYRVATGSGKTRTTIALVDLLMRCNWVKRVLFLADRRALVKQAKDAFNKHLPDATVVNLITEKNNDGGRVYVSTYPTMMGLIDEATDGLRRFGPGYFDLIVIDEAHRSVYQKYGAIFEYFDALLVGLTATPKDEVDINTYSLFDLERGIPTTMVWTTRSRTGSSCRRRPSRCR